MLDKHVFVTNQAYLKRKIDTYLFHWKRDIERKPLIVKGTRQIGNTEVVKKVVP